MGGFDLHPDLVEALGLGREWPIAQWRAWDHGDGRTSQWRALLPLADFLTILVWGGNKSGKTELNLAAAVAYALGGDHPAVQAWLRGNRLPLDMVPDGPGRVWMLAPTHDASKRFHRHRVEALVGVGAGYHGWRMRDAAQEAVLKIEVPGYSKRAEIWFKAHKQGIDGMKGDAIRYLGVDEQCPEGMLNEALKRLTEDERNRCVFSMTHDPHSGVSWVHDRFIVRGEPDATEVAIDVRDNPHVPKGLMERRTAGMTEVERAAALTGRFGTVHGLCFEFARGIHVVPSRVLPADWPRYAAFDFGWSNPNCILWGALDPDGVLEIYREFYQSRLTAAQVAEMFLAICAEADESIVAAWGDPTALTSVEEIRNAGIPITAAHRDVEDSIKAVNARFGADPPTLRIQRGATRLLTEMARYRRGPNGKPIKVNDHGCDDLRYIVRGVNEHAGSLVDWTGALSSGELDMENPWNM